VRLPALLDTSSLDTAGVVAALEALTEQMTEADADSALSMSKRAKLAQQYIGIHKGAVEVRDAAFRLEVMSLRRLAQLVTARPKEIGGLLWAAATFFAQRTEAELDLQMKHSDRRTAIGLWNDIKWRFAPRELRAGHDEVNSLNYHRNVAAETAESVQAAVKHLLEVAPVDSPFTIEHLADAVAERINVEGDLAKRALQGRVRDHVNGLITGEGPLAGGPAYITYEVEHDEGSEWLRIPLREATFGQFRSFIAHRRVQAANLANQVDRMSDFLAALESHHVPDYPDDSVPVRWAIEQETAPLRRTRARRGVA
jgi:hypothetical protein